MQLILAYVSGRYSWIRTKSELDILGKLDTENARSDFVRILASFAILGIANVVPGTIEYAYKLNGVLLASAIDHRTVFFLGRLKQHSTECIDCFHTIADVCIRRSGSNPLVPYHSPNICACQQK